MGTSVNYSSTPRTASAQISTANTNRDGTGTLVTVFTAGTNGSRIDDIIIQATGSTTAGMVRLFLNDGSTTRLWQEVSITVATPSATAQAFRAALSNQALVLASSSWNLRASTHNAETFNVIVTRAGDF
jgi:hypothetical protein